MKYHAKEWESSLWIDRENKYVKQWMLSFVLRMNGALASVAQLVGCHPANQKVKGFGNNFKPSTSKMANYLVPNGTYLLITLSGLKHRRIIIFCSSFSVWSIGAGNLTLCGSLLSYISRHSFIYSLKCPLVEKRLIVILSLGKI